MKIGVHLTIDEEIVKKIKEQAKAETRSVSFIANRILGEHHGIQETQP